MDEKAIKIAAIGMIILTVLSMLLMPKMPEIRTRAEEWRENQVAEAEQAVDQIEMTQLEMENIKRADEAAKGQIRLRLPEEVEGEDIKVTNNYVLQTINIEIPNTDGTYFDSFPIAGSSNHINHLSYAINDGDGLIAIEMDKVYELETSFDEDYYYFDFLSPHEVYDKVVVIDAGHGGRTPGATRQGIKEKNLNLNIVLQLKEIFDSSEENIGVYYTRLDDSNPTFDQRVQLANKSEADLFISVHNNSLVKSTRTKGTQVMYSESDTKELGSMQIAQLLLDEITKELGSVDKGLVEGDDIYIIRTSEVPVALIEVGFMTNKEELELLNTEEYQRQTAEAIYQSVLKAFEMGY